MWPELLLFFFLLVGVNKKEAVIDVLSETQIQRVTCESVDSSESK